MLHKRAPEGCSRFNCVSGMRRQIGALSAWAAALHRKPHRPRREARGRVARESWLEPSGCVVAAGFAIDRRFATQRSPCQLGVMKSGSNRNRRDGPRGNSSVRLLRSRIAPTGAVVSVRHRSEQASTAGHQSTPPQNCCRQTVASGESWNDVNPVRTDSLASWQWSAIGPGAKLCVGWRCATKCCASAVGAKVVITRLSPAAAARTPPLTDL